MTGARLALCAAWPAFADATERSNRQALSPLEGVPDLLLVAALPAAAEELLFRGALIPAVYPDWYAALRCGDQGVVSEAEEMRE